jgi:hypothetical protein
MLGENASDSYFHRAQPVFPLFLSPDDLSGVPQRVFGTGVFALAIEFRRFPYRAPIEIRLHSSVGIEELDLQLRGFEPEEVDDRTCRRLSERIRQGCRKLHTALKMTHSKARIEAVQLIDKYGFLQRARPLSPQNPVQRADRLRETVGTGHIQRGSFDRRDAQAVYDLSGSCPKAGGGLPHARFGSATPSPFVENRDVGRPVLVDGHSPEGRRRNTSQSRWPSGHREGSPCTEKMSLAKIGAVPDATSDECPTSKPYQDAALSVAPKPARIVEDVPNLIEENQSVVAESVVVHAQNLPAFGGWRASNPPFWEFLRSPTACRGGEMTSRRALGPHP